MLNFADGWDRFVKVKEAISKIEAAWSMVETMGAAHPLIMVKVNTAFRGVLALLLRRDTTTGVMQVLADVQAAYLELANAYSDEKASGALNDFAEKLQSIVS